MVSNGPKTHFNGLLIPFDPFWPVPPCILGLPRPFGGPKGAQNGPQRVQKWPKMAPKWSKSWNLGFSVSAGNALKWYPNGLKRSQNTFLWPVGPFWPLLAGSPLHFGAPKAIWGPKMAQNGQNVHINGQNVKTSKWPKNGQNGAKTRFYGVLAPYWPLLVGSPLLFWAHKAILAPFYGPLMQQYAKIPLRWAFKLRKK